MKITFIDTGVLIVAARGEDEMSEKALEILDDPDREFASSPFLKLETVPKAMWFGNKEEVQFYDAFFRDVSHWPVSTELVVQRAPQEASRDGLGPMDALHVAAASIVGADEFITTEKAEKSIHRATGVTVTSIQP